MHQAVLAGFAAIAAASPAAQGIDFAAINAAPSPSLAGPPVTANKQSFDYNTASVNAEGSAAATGVASASAIASQVSNSKRNFWPGWPWGWAPEPSSSKSQTWGNQPKPTTSISQPWGGKPTTSSSESWVPSTTTTQNLSTGTATNSSGIACLTTPEAGTYCGFISPDDPCAVQPDGSWTPFSLCCKANMTQVTDLMSHPIPLRHSKPILNRNKHSPRLLPQIRHPRMPKPQIADYQRALGDTWLHRRRYPPPFQ
jgi:hypothetical protein